MLSHKKRNIFIIIGISIASLISIGIYNEESLKTYYNDFKYERFKQGDKIYAYKYFVDDISHSKIELYRLVKSNSSSDMKIIITNQAFMSDSMFKYKSSFMGTMIKKKFVPLSDKGVSYIKKFYAISPNLKVLHIFPEIKFDLPTGYSYIDTNYYIPFAVASAKEENTF
ncbi:hypothetical protein IDJ75_01790 [Mucilaginibacter rigui]|uniref:Uncharacterized protein n=1 Tax=Mucilaginibacter rigui TaxID=534635 RepID=A0ABR7X073_9SPHI|nr:hypothetical protein [Mucilaginibacter rigui]MBD1383992.1 hypothetical protein [Mucilaginibacter rigui]